MISIVSWFSHALSLISAFLECLTKNMFNKITCEYHTYANIFVEKCMENARYSVKKPHVFFTILKNPDAHFFGIWHWCARNAKNPRGHTAVRYSTGLVIGPPSHRSISLIEPPNPSHQVCGTLRSSVRAF
jgi:hypothetical protein